MTSPNFLGVSDIPQRRPPLAGQFCRVTKPWVYSVSDGKSYFTREWFWMTTSLHSWSTVVAESSVRGLAESAFTYQVSHSCLATRCMFELTSLRHAWPSRPFHLGDFLLAPVSEVVGRRLAATFHLIDRLSMTTPGLESCQQDSGPCGLVAPIKVGGYHPTPSVSRPGVRMVIRLR